MSSYIQFHAALKRDGTNRVLSVWETTEVKARVEIARQFSKPGRLGIRKRWIDAGSIVKVDGGEHPC